MAKIRVEIGDGIAIIELNDPPANTYTHEMMRELDDGDPRGALRRRRPRDRDHAARARSSSAPAPTSTCCKSADPDFKYYFCLHANETLTALEQTPKLVIAAINGHTRRRRARDRAWPRDIRIARKGAGKSACPRSRSACSPAPAARSGSRAWSGMHYCVGSSIPLGRCVFPFSTPVVGN